MKRKPDDSIPGYVAKILNTFAAKPGTVVHVEVCHEPHCKLLRGRGACTCQPEVRELRPN
jgi:hypothetical protein